MEKEKNVAVEADNNEVEALKKENEQLRAQLEDIAGRYQRLFKLYANNLDIFLAGEAKK